ncbi:UDP-2,4-diacetamido-2,4,6-trideoxy-beta-L-altropyranose hydrolase [Haloferax profundi]|uniref:UDP-2,4-diacetamido-2,4, 6-trideoxy-beta-L-altropyranose hydrolase n=1 Tax=Haloferax profundi TaxID=1544718 RepID=A0A0W1SWT0_9EURY|nr:UDP-2,4-diacetamido-2,4,6-trideoxy-beta-L-altropyranose hydrolase [Haloferax profundi]KTG30923.1 hypothetical protein AUR66_05560 [Haloferax profundi]
MIVIRADGGPDIGYGHLVRSSALAAEFLSRGFDVTYATTTPGAVSDVCPPAVETKLLSVRDNPDPFVSWLGDSNTDAVIADSYLVDTNYMRTVRDSVSVLAVISDDTRFEFAADILINGNLYAESLDYDFVGEHPKCLLGTRYVLLREEVRKRSGTRSPVREQPRRAVVTMGGSDIRSYTPTAVRAFDGFDMTVDVVLGPGVEHTTEVEEAADLIDTEVVIHNSPDEFLSLIARADMAVSGCGSTTYELLALGTPFVGVVQATNQEPIATALDSRGLADVLPMDAAEELLYESIDSLLRDRSRRATFQSRGQELVDGRGAERTCNSILAEAHRP